MVMPLVAEWKGTIMRKDITDTIEAFASVHTDSGEVLGIYSSRLVAERSTMSEGNCKIVRLVPAHSVLLEG